MSFVHACVCRPLGAAPIGEKSAPVLPSLRNADKALKATMAEMPQLARRLHPAQQEAFFGMLEQALASDSAIGTAERRTLRRALSDKMEAAGIDDARRLADLLLDLGVRGELGDAWPLLRHADRDWLLNLAYDLTRLRANSDTILSASNRLATLVVALKNYARIESGRDLQPVDVRSSIETVLELYGEQLGKGVEIGVHGAPAAGHGVRSDARRGAGGGGMNPALQAGTKDAAEALAPLLRR